MPESTYSIEGLKTGPWLTLSHPIGSDRTTWAGQISVLARRYRVLSYDIRGHGRAPSQGPACCVDDLAADVHGLWQHLGIERSHFVGLSLGGCIGLALAHLHPEKVQSLVIANARLEMDAGATQMWMGRAANVESGGMAPVVEPTLERWLTPAFRASQPMRVDAVRRILAATPPEGFAACAQALADMHQAHRLLDLQVPTLLLAGLADLAVPHELVRAYANVNARLQFVELAGPHMVHLENPGGFSRAVLDFLAPQ